MEVNGWAHKSLEEVANLKSGETITAASISEMGMYPCYGGNGLRGWVSDKTHNGHFTLIGRQGALCGNINEVHGSFFASEHAIVVTAKQGINTSFLSHQLDKMNLNQHSESSAQPGLSVEKLKKLAIYLPENEKEQQLIAEALNDADALITSLEKLIEKKNHIFSGVKSEVFNQANASFEYEKTSLGLILSYEQPTKYIVRNPQLNSNGKVPVLTANKAFILGYTNELSGIKSDLPVIIFDDFTTDKKFVDFNFKVRSSAMKILCARCSDINTYYVFQAMTQIDFPTSEHKRYWIGEYQKLRIPLPNFGEQNRVALLLEDIDNEIKSIKFNLEKAKKVKEGMKQELLTGRIRLI